MARITTILAALMLLASACGGSSDGIDDNDASPAASGAQSDGGGSSDEPAEGGDDDSAGSDSAEGDSAQGEGTGPSTATVTLGDQTYEFSTEGAVVAQCKVDLFGVFSAQLPMVGGDGGGVQIIVLHEGTDPAVVEQVNAVSVSIGDDDWVGDEASDLFAASDKLLPGMSQVDSAEVDGRTVRGTATFVRQMSAFTGEVETMTGSFEATCGEDRLS